jgi:hypothetical protein
MNIITLQGEDNYWPLAWVNPQDPSDSLNTAGFVHPIGHWITRGGPLAGNVAEKLDLLQHPESTQAHLVLTVVDILTMGVKNYVPRRDFEKISQLMERRWNDEERADQSAAEASDQTHDGEGLPAEEEVGTAQTAAGY